MMNIDIGMSDEPRNPETETMKIEQAERLGWQFSWDTINKCWWACKGDDMFSDDTRYKLILEIQIKEKYR